MAVAIQEHDHHTVERRRAEHPSCKYVQLDSPQDFGLLIFGHLIRFHSGGRSVPRACANCRSTNGGVAKPVCKERIDYLFKGSAHFRSG